MPRSRRGHAEDSRDGRVVGTLFLDGIAQHHAAFIRLADGRDRLRQKRNSLFRDDDLACLRPDGYVQVDLGAQPAGLEAGGDDDRLRGRSLVIRHDREASAVAANLRDRRTWEIVPPEPAESGNQGVVRLE